MNTEREEQECNLELEEQIRIRKAMPKISAQVTREMAAKGRGEQLKIEKLNEAAAPRPLSQREVQRLAQKVLSS